MQQLLTGVCLQVAVLSV